VAGASAGIAFSSSGGMGRLPVKRCMLLSLAMAWPALADTPIDSMEPIGEVVHVRVAPNGELIFEDPGPTNRVNTIHYGMTGGLFYGTTSAPRWNIGDICSFGPEGAGATNTLINVVRFPIQMPDGSLNQTGRCTVRLWNLDPLQCHPTNGAFDTLIGGFQVTINEPGLSDPTPGNAQGIIFLFQVAVDDVFPADNGMIVPTDTWGLQLTYRTLDDQPHTVWSVGFATNMVNTADPMDPANCVDPLTQPNPGSSFTNAAGDALYMRDANGDGMLTVGDANGCIGTPNDIRGFGATCPQRIIANPYLELTFDPPPNACGLDQTVTDTDNNGSEQVTLDATCADDDTFIDTYTWSENNTVLVTGASPIEVVNLAVGVHDLTLEVEDEFGVSSTDAVRVEVRPGGNPCPCPGDFVAPFGGPRDINDLAALLGVYGTVPTNPCMDMAAPNGGPIDINDLSAFLSVYGQPCP
jgi:hypothetical protein